jgi:hypothetical protein
VLEVLAIVVAVVLSATSAARKGTLLATAPLPVPAVGMADMVVTKAIAAAAGMEEDVLPVKIATPAVVLGTWPEIALKALDRNVIIVGILMS